MSKLESIKFYNDCELLDHHSSDNDSKNNYEKIKLEFSILHASGGLYNIQAKLFDEQSRDFISENKRISSKQKIIFDKFFYF